MAIKNSQNGFTLIEMLVVIAIFGVVASVLLLHYSDFSTDVAVKNLAEEIGLSVRKAQSYATSVRSIDGTNSILSDTFPAYGISFSTQSSSSTLYDPTLSSFVLFADNLYENSGSCGNPAPGSECVESFDITSGDKVVSLCTSTNAGDTPDCSAKTVNVVFHRPNPDATICVVNDGACLAPVSDLIVTVESPKGLQDTITLWNTGQISVN
jgi:prepilin-type N-terminal cleavage/methylation domain-containing protein